MDAGGILFDGGGGGCCRIFGLTAAGAVYDGDTGSFAIGAGLGVVAMMTNSFFLLPIIELCSWWRRGRVGADFLEESVLQKVIDFGADTSSSFGSERVGEAKIVMRFG